MTVVQLTVEVVHRLLRKGYGEELREKQHVEQHANEHSRRRRRRCDHHAKSRDHWTPTVLTSWGREEIGSGGEHSGCVPRKEWHKAERPKTTKPRPHQ